MDTWASTPRAPKRGRSDSLSSVSSAGSSLSSTSTSPAPLNKVQRASPTPASDELECSLPPTCFPVSRAFSSATELERHQQAFHTFICRKLVRDKENLVRDRAGPSESDPWGVPREFSSRIKKGDYGWKECRKVFPDQRLLDLHDAETHDPVIRAKQKEGISTFQCFIPPPECTRVFINPKHRRMHLIHKHKYPDHYFFAITCHGLNRITENEGLGASLIRPRRDDPPATPTEPRNAEAVDVEMEELTKGMKGLESSLSIVPAQLRRKGKGKNKVGARTATPLESGIGG